MKLKRAITLFVITAMFFTCAQIMTGTEVDAATAPKGVSKFGARGITAYKATLYWSKVNGVSGYAIAKNGTTIRYFGPNVLQMTDVGLAINTTYYYSVRTYKLVRTRQWYNKQTRKWQNSMPAKKYRGSSRYANVKVFGASLPLKVKTTNPVYRGHGITIKANQIGSKPYTFKEKGTACSECGRGGLTWTLTFDRVKGIFSLRTVGNSVDYRKACHHHDSISLVGKCDTGGAQFGKDNNGNIGLIDKSNEGVLLNDQTHLVHSHNFPGMTQAELAEMALSALREMKVTDSEGNEVKKYPDVKWNGGKSFTYTAKGTARETSGISVDTADLKVDGNDIYCSKTPIKWGDSTIYCYDCGKPVSRPANW